MKHIFTYGVWFTMLLTPILIHSQNKIKGHVYDEQNTPVMGAEIYIEQLHIGTTSDLDGFFELQNVPKGTHKLSVTFIGFKTQNSEILVASDDVNLDVTLEPSVFHMDEVIVSAPFNKLQSENVMKIETKSIEALKKSGSPTLMESINTMPGVSQITTGNGIGKPVIRGLSGNRVLVYSQGVRLENQQFGSEHGLGMSDSGVESVEIIKGPASLLYGSDALGGVMYLNPEKFAFQNETKADLSQNFYSNTLGSNTSLGIKTSGEKLKFLARGGFNSHVDYEVPDGSRVTNTRFNEKDFKAGIGLNLDQFVTEFRYNYNHSNIGIPEGIEEQTTERDPELPYQDLKTHILSLHNHLYLRKSKFDLNLGYLVNQRKEYEGEHDHGDEVEQEEAHDTGHPALDMDLKTFTYDLKYNLPKMGRFETITGIQGMIQDNKNHGEEILIPDAETRDFGILVTSTVKVDDNSAVQGGIRYDQRHLSSAPYEIVDEDHSDEVVTIESLDRNFSNFTFSLGYKTLLFQKVTARANVASGFRAPNLAELTSYGVHHGSNRFEIGDPDLKSEQNIQVDLSVNYTNQHWELFANGFYNHLNNYIFSSPTAEEMDGYQVFEYIQNDARLYGGEFGFHLHPHPLDWLHLESSYELVVGEEDSGTYLPLIPANKWANTIRVELKGTGRFNEIYGAFGVDSYLRQDRVSTNETVTPAYSLLNLRMGGNIDFVKMSLSVRLSLNNLLNETYISHLSLLKHDMIPNPGRNVTLGLNLKIF